MTFLLYIGVFAQRSKAKTYLLPIRAEFPSSCGSYRSGTWRFT